MVELYNDQLLDLFDGKHSTKLDVKKDKKGRHFEQTLKSDHV